MASITEDIQNLAMDNVVEPEPIPLNNLSGGRVASRSENVLVNQEADQDSDTSNQRASQPCAKHEYTFNQIQSQPGSSHWIPGTSSGIGKVILNNGRSSERFFIEIFNEFIIR